MADGFLRDGKFAEQAAYAARVRDILKTRVGGTPKACVTTYGCQQNVADSERIKGMLKDMGYAFTDDRQAAKLVIFNTCAVREHAEDRVFGNVGALKKYKLANPDVIIALCGCMIQQKHIAKKIEESFPFVDLVFGTHVVHRLPELLYTALTRRKRVFELPDIDGVIAEGIPVKRDNENKAWLPIMYGCNNFCSYCIVPYVRGRERSREADEIVAEIENLVKDGVIEVMLLGQNVNSYGKNLEDPISFAELLRRVEKIEGLERIRFMTSHPKDLSDELIEVIKNSKKICHHLHLPLQSGSSRILKSMNRVYDKKKYLDLALKIRREIPDISITTDIIVGFPGETKEDVDDTLDVIRKVEFDNAFTFIYSVRTGTPAAKMEQLDEKFVKEQFDRVLSLVQETARKRVELIKGLTLPVLVEEINKQNEEYLTGRLSNNTIVHFKGNPDLIGKIVNVKCNECKGFYYIGEVVE